MGNVADVFLTVSSSALCMYKTITSSKEKYNFTLDGFTYSVKLFVCYYQLKALGQARASDVRKLNDLTILQNFFRIHVTLIHSDVFEMIVEDGRIILEPKKLVPADQAWYWSEEWQAGEREAREDIATGRVIRARSVEELMEKLNSGDEGEV